MKIGILTFHFGNNYGGILQCYALQQVLKSLGHDVEVIDYQPLNPSIVVKVINKIKTITSVSLFIKILLSYVLNKTYSYDSKKVLDEKKEILNAFNQFRTKYLNISEKAGVQNIGRISEKYDAIIVGSDQVWTSLYDRYSIYFLDWKPKFKGKKISYAACSAHNTIQKRRAEYLHTLLSEFDQITVRDTTTANLIHQITGSYPEIVMDPTYLYPFDEFLSPKEEEAYILTYVLGSEIAGGHDAAIKKIKDRYGNLKVISIIIPGGANTITKNSDQVYTDISPEKWVYLFSKATFVYTDSFHGSMFSIKFRKPFLAYYSNVVRASRLIDLRDRFNLDAVIVDSASNALVKDFSYKNMIDLFEKYSSVSVNILKNI